MALCRVDRLTVLKCSGYELDSWLIGHLEKDSVHWRGRKYVNVQCGECRLRLRVQIFLFISIDQSEATKSHMFDTIGYIIKIDQSQRSHGKIVSKDNM